MASGRAWVGADSYLCKRLRTNWLPEVVDRIREGQRMWLLCDERPAFSPQSTGRSVELSRILAVQAVEAGLEEAGTAVTVGAVAERLEVDQSIASRLVADTIRDGYLSRATSEADGRRSRLDLTEAGRELAGESRRYQRSIFEDFTRGWPASEREEFARLLAKFVDSVAEASLDPDPPSTQDES